MHLDKYVTFVTVLVMIVG